MADETPQPATPTPATNTLSKPPRSPSPTAVRLAVPWPHSLFESGVDGVPAITRDGTDVPTALAEHVKAAYRAAFGDDTTHELLEVKA